MIPGAIENVMIVYVATPEQIDAAFADWIKLSDSPDREREVLHKVYTEFMATDTPVRLFRWGSIISFNTELWKQEFTKWVDLQLEQAPQSKDNILKWTSKLSSHIESPWCHEHGLVVTECLDKNDLARISNTNSRRINMSEDVRSSLSERYANST